VTTPSGSGDLYVDDYQSEYVSTPSSGGGSGGYSNTYGNTYGGEVVDSTYEDTYNDVYTGPGGVTAAVMTATATVTAVAPLVVAGVRVAAPVATATAQAGTPSFSVISGGKIYVPSANASASAGTPTVTTGAQVFAPRIEIVNISYPPAVTSSYRLEVPVTASEVSAHAPTVRAGAIVAPPPAAVLAQTHVPSVTGVISVVVRPPAATGSATAHPPGISGFAAVRPPAATATVTWRTPTAIRGGGLVDAKAAEVLAEAHPPTIGLGVVAYPDTATITVNAVPPGVTAKDPYVSTPKFHPIFASPEDLLLAILKPLEDEIPGLKVRTMIEDDTFTTPYVMVHAGSGAWVSDSFANADNRLWRRFLADVQVWTSGRDAEEKAWLLHELVRRKIQHSFDSQTVYPGLGHLAGFRTNSPAHKTPDWATATGVNQYANLPKGMVRYQAMYGMAMRPPLGEHSLNADDLAAFILS
jgi:hypothetical protein